MDDYLKNFFIVVSVTNFTLGITKSFPMEKIIPFLNLPIRKDLFLTLSIFKFYFDFSFSFMLLLFLSSLSLMRNLSSVDLIILIGTAIIYSLIFQQIGFLIRILKMSYLVKVLILLLFVLGCLIVSQVTTYHEDLLFISNRIYLLICGIALFAGFIVITKKNICRNLIDYL
jgi:hypothetical protein